MSLKFLVIFFFFAAIVTHLPIIYLFIHFTFPRKHERTLNIKRNEYLIFIIYLQDCVVSLEVSCLDDFSSRIPCHNVFVIREYVAPNIIKGITNSITSKYKLNVFSYSSEPSGQYSRHLWWPVNKYNRITFLLLNLWKIMV